MNIRGYRGLRPQLGSRVYVDPSAIVIGQVAAGDDVSFWPAAVARGDVNEIRIGARTNIQDGTILHVTHDGPYSPGGLPLLIGEDVTVGHQVTLHACTLGNRCLIGMQSCVMDGALLEDEVLLGAGSLVTPGQSLSGASLYRGRPARRIRGLEREELEMLGYMPAHYVRLKDEYLAGA